VEINQSDYATSGECPHCGSGLYVSEGKEERHYYCPDCLYVNSVKDDDRITESQARRFLSQWTSFCSDEERERRLKMMRDTGYIKKSSVDEAEEMYRYWLSSPTRFKNETLIKKLYEALQEQKEELEAERGD
jgi:DNA-directed RNA polymerase subunit M/transcription elongation factor TFIIS